ncbi:MAG TPA: acyl-CoA dehydrogenase [Acidimicrobiales bacterium]|jgi:alkylation response protein AidB-like acyl-CoA dehydrogenase|nr:acyl-CoA dehydrogenase [Acidimicrobiales bacterium]
MPIAITDEHQELGATVRGLLSAHGALAASRALLESPDEPRPSFWQEMADLGMLGVHLPEAHGGGGASLSELVVILEELGRQVAPGPFVPTALASAVIAQCGTEEQQSAYLPALADGSVTGALGLGGSLTLDAQRLDGDGGIVLGGKSAELLLLRAGEDVVILRPDTAGITLAGTNDIDPSRRSALATVSAVAVAGADVLTGAARRARALARTVGAAESAGVMTACTDMAVAYAQERMQFGRTIGTFQAVKHHCADMLVASQLATATAWDAARSAADTLDEFDLIAAMAAHLAFAPAVHNAQMNIQVHGGIGFTWEHDAHLFLRRALALNALLGSPGDAEDVTSEAERGTTREVTLDLPPEAEVIRTEVRAEAARIGALSDKSERRKALIDAGLLVPHWPRPWGRDAGAVEQIVIDEEMRAAGVKVPGLGITGWNIMTVNQYATPDQVDRWVEKTLMGEYVWCQLFSEPDAGSDAAAVKTRGTRVEGGWMVNGQKVWTSGAQYCHLGLATVRTDPDAPKHSGITTMVIDMHGSGVEVRPLRQITGNADFNEVFFSDVFVPDDDVVGTVNDGWTVARSTLGNERVSIGGGTGGIFPPMDLLALRKRGGDRVPGASARIGGILAKEHALKALNLRRAQRAVVGAGPGPEGNVTKLVLAEHGHDRARLQADLVGEATAFLGGEDALAGYTQLATRAMSIAGGTSEITRNQIAERILGLPRDPLIR